MANHQSFEGKSSSTLGSIHSFFRCSNNNSGRELLLTYDFPGNSALLCTTTELNTLFVGSLLLFPGDFWPGHPSRQKWSDGLWRSVTSGPDRALQRGRRLWCFTTGSFAEGGKMIRWLPYLVHVPLNEGG